MLSRALFEGSVNIAAEASAARQSSRILYPVRRTAKRGDSPEVIPFQKKLLFVPYPYIVLFRMNPAFFRISRSVSLLAPLKNCARICINLEIIFDIVINDLPFILASSVVPVQFNSYVLFRCSGYPLQRNLNRFILAEGRSGRGSVSCISLVLISRLLLSVLSLVCLVPCCCGLICSLIGC